MILIPILALFVGLLLGAQLSSVVPPALAPYLSVAVLAGLDSICGGSRSYLEGKFQADIFSSGFLFNILLAIFFVWLGLGIGLNLLLAVAVVFGTRIFTNLSLIRRVFVSRMSDQKAKRMAERESAAKAESESA